MRITISRRRALIAGTGSAAGLIASAKLGGSAFGDVDPFDPPLPPPERSIIWQQLWGGVAAAACAVGAVAGIDDVDDPPTARVAGRDGTYVLSIDGYPKGIYPLVGDNVYADVSVTEDQPPTTVRGRLLPLVDPIEVPARTALAPGRIVEVPGGRFEVLPETVIPETVITDARHGRRIAFVTRPSDPVRSTPRALAVINR